jgi:hypothetical protein
MPLPAVFCWTKFGTESGEAPSEIFERKERERLGNDGVFLWGIGNSIRPSVDALLASTDDPQVLFTPMISAPAAVDVNPDQVFIWQAAHDRHGDSYRLPTTSLVTSRATIGRTRHRHYALVCYSDSCLTEPLTNGTAIDRSLLRNLRTGAMVGSSQVTSVVRRINESVGSGPEYAIRLRARLVAPYFIELSDPVPVDDHVRPRLPGDERFGILERVRRVASGVFNKHVA